MQTSTKSSGYAHGLRLITAAIRIRLVCVKYRPRSISLLCRAERCSRAPTHTYMWLALQNHRTHAPYDHLRDHLVIPTKSFLSLSTQDLNQTQCNHSSTQPPSVDSSRLQLLWFQLFVIASCQFKRQFVKPPLHQYRMCAVQWLNYLLFYWFIYYLFHRCTCHY